MNEHPDYTIGAGMVALDYFVCVFLYFGSLLNFANARVATGGRLYAAGRRLVGAGMLVLAMRITYSLWYYGDYYVGVYSLLGLLLWGLGSVALNFNFVLSSEHTRERMNAPYSVQKKSSVPERRGRLRRQIDQKAYTKLKEEESGTED